jgi:alpha-beta hydrolase superfamily lysophospholipase
MPISDGALDVQCAGYVERGADGREIAAWRWGAGPTPVLVVHGFGDHGRALPYQQLAVELAKHQRPMVTYDHRGHGTDRAAMAGVRWTDLCRDLTEVRNALEARIGVPPVVLGVSMGALVALDTAIAGQLGQSRVITIGAPVGPLAASRVAVMASRVLGRVWPTLPIRPNLDKTSIASDARTVRAYTSDPLFHQDMTAGFGSDLLSAHLRVRTSGVSLQNAVTMVYGTADRIAPWDGEFARQVQPHLCAVRRFNGYRHNLLLEPSLPEVAAMVATEG